MKKILIGALALTVLSGFGLTGQGHEGSHGMGESHEATAVTVTGQIVDPVCLLMHGDSGPDHRDCAQACAKMGIGLVFYNEQDHQLYNIMPTGHANPNDKVIDFAEKHVEITGTIHKKAGYQSIEIQSIKELGEGQKLSLQD